MGEGKSGAKVAPSSITLIRWDRKEVYLEWDAVREDGKTDTRTLRCKDAPLDGFQGAMEAMSKHTAELIEDQDWVDCIQVNKVKIGTGKHARMKVQLCAIAKLEMNNSPLPLNLPWFHEATDEGGPNGCFTDECRDAVLKLQEEASRYLQGYRQEQPTTGDLYEDQDEDETANPLDGTAA